MTNLQPTGGPRHVSRISVVVVYVLAVAAWLGAFAVVAGADGVDDPARYYTMAVVLAVIGTGLIVIAAIYDLFADH